MWDIVWVSAQGHRSVSVSRLFLLQAPQCPCSVRNGSAETAVAERGRNPVAGLWGHTLGEYWPPEPTSSYASIDFWSQLVASLATTASWMSVVAMILRIWGWIGQLSCLTIFSTSLSVAAFLRRAGGSMLESTGSHGRGVERRVPEITPIGQPLQVIGYFFILLYRALVVFLKCVPEVYVWTSVAVFQFSWQTFLVVWISLPLISFFRTPRDVLSCFMTFCHFVRASLMMCWSNSLGTYTSVICYWRVTKWRRIKIDMHLLVEIDSVVQITF